MCYFVFYVILYVIFYGEEVVVSSGSGYWLRMLFLMVTWLLVGAFAVL